MGALAISGSVVDLPDGTIARTFDERIACSPAPERRVVVLSTDSPVSVQLDGLAGVTALFLESSASVAVTLTYGAGSPSDHHGETIIVVSRAVPITAISLVRVAGQATTVSLILGQGV
jgi:hypothetical protein